MHLENPMKWEFDWENPGARKLLTAGKLGRSMLRPYNVGDCASDGAD